MINQLQTNKLYCRLMLVLLYVLAPGMLMAQSFKVSGIVYDDKKTPLPGVAVFIHNTSKGATTNHKGEFEIPGVKKSDMLMFAYIGMEKKAVPVGDNRTFNVIMEPSSSQIDDVVVIGYGTVKKSDLTGSVKSVGASSFANQELQSVEHALKGRVSGVRVLSDYSPGGGISIQIRGSNSMLGGTEPLYVIDGFPVEPNTDAQGAGNTSPSQSSLNFINPDDIESMEVLKDASATAIYGARGANGVVLITTKSGKSGATTVTYNGHVGVSTVSKHIDVLDAQEFTDYMNQREINSFWVRYDIINHKNEDGTFGYGGWRFQGTADLALPFGGYRDPENLTGIYKKLPHEWGAGTDWQREIYRTAISTEHSVSVQGGNDKTKVSLSLGYSNKQGVVINSDFERFTLANTIEHKTSNSIKIRNKFNTSYAKASSNSVATGDVFANRSLISNTLWFQPIFDKITEPNDDYQEDGYNESPLNNPYLHATLFSDNKTSQVFQDVANVEWSIAKGLVATGTLGFIRSTNERGQYWPSVSKRGMNFNGDATVSDNEKIKYMTEARLNYQTKIKNAHTLSAMVAWSYENINFKSKSIRATGFPSDDLLYKNLNSALKVYPIDDSYWKSELVSLISRVNYKYKERYLLTLTMRADGSSRAATNQKWGYFPSAAFAWRVTEESFIPKMNWLNNLKWRLSYGRTGSDPYSPYQSLTMISVDQKYPFDNTLHSSAIQQNAGNSALTWETTDQYNTGIDISFFNSKLNVALDFYYKVTRDLLQRVQLAPSGGFRDRLMNLGKVENRGFEFEISSPIITTSKHRLSVELNGSVNKNKLLSLGNRNYIEGNKIGGSPINRFMVGEPLGIFWGYQILGVFRDWEQVLVSDDGKAQRDALPGSVRFKDLNGDDKISIEDYTKIGDPNPDFVFGVNLNYSYKKFDFNLLLSGQIGGDVYWVDYGSMTNMWRTTNMYAPAYADSWKAPWAVDAYDQQGNHFLLGNANGNMNAAYPRASNSDKDQFNLINENGEIVKRGKYASDQANDGLVLDGTNVKIQNISVGYTFDKIKYIKSLRLSVSASNLWTFSKYPGYDPELVSSSSPMMRGIDLGSYPSTRTITFNAQITF